MQKIDILSMNLTSLEKMLKEKNQPSYKAKQIYEWLHKKQVVNFLDMTNISKELIDYLNTYCYIVSLKPVTILESKIDGTIKFLLSLSDDNCVECVLMRYSHGNSICISTQVGCKMGCAFCASTKAGFVRNLTVSEMLGQVYFVKKYINERISNIVLMGIGEPLDNYNNTIDFLNLISDKNGENISQRHISVSTCGLVDKIYELAELKLGITLSCSLHATNDTLRSKTMPINNKYNINELINACKYYINRTNRRISFEYALINGVNDSINHANELVKLLKGILCHVNLIPVNEIDESNFKKSNMKNVNIFQKHLTNSGINVTIRRTLGKDINAACGQLRKEKL